MCNDASEADLGVVAALYKTSVVLINCLYAGLPSTLAMSTAVPFEKWMLAVLGIAISAIIGRGGLIVAYSPITK